jgi:hypothetical protein
VEMFSQANTLVARALLLRDHFATAQRAGCAALPPLRARAESDFFRRFRTMIGRRNDSLIASAAAVSFHVRIGQAAKEVLSFVSFLPSQMRR